MDWSMVRDSYIFCSSAHDGAGVGTTAYDILMQSDMAIANIATILDHHSFLVT
jgi:hypothetical protein